MTATTAGTQATSGPPASQACLAVAGIHAGDPLLSLASLFFRTLSLFLVSMLLLASLKLLTSPLLLASPLILAHAGQVYSNLSAYVSRKK
jgi:hypothetical protein